jgi:hypothetical protein
MENLAKIFKVPYNSVAYDTMRSTLELSKRPSQLARRGPMAKSPAPKPVDEKVPSSLESESPKDSGDWRRSPYW